MQRNLLIFGATGATGKHVVTASLAANGTVTVFVRRPEALPVDQLPLLNVIKGDYTDLDAVKQAVHDTHPTAIIITASLKSGAPMSQRLNSLAVPAIIESLRQDGRLADTRIIYLGGGFTPEKNAPLPWSLRFLKIFADPILGLAALAQDNTAAAEALYALEDNEAQWVFVRMFLVMEGAKSKLTLGPQLVAGSTSWCVTFADVAALLVQLAVVEDLGSSKNRAIEMSYSS
ncbi:hypothetical protein HDU98_002375 [Podochytrium sp. JEL0797]|nr:hypothetical protein HDU98_002375 [Podochytrium sp. JEL0797]